MEGGRDPCVKLPSRGRRYGVLRQGWKWNRNGSFRCPRFTKSTVATPAFWSGDPWTAPPSLGAETSPTHRSSTSAPLVGPDVGVSGTRNLVFPGEPGGWGKGVQCPSGADRGL